MKRKRVLVFTETALALSETFIANHCRSLQGFDGTLVALHASADHHADVPRQLLYEQARPGAMSRLAFRLGRNRRLDNLITQLKPDLIHAHYLTNGAFMQPYANRHGIPLVVTAHGHDATRKLRTGSIYDQVYRLQRRNLLRGTAMVLPVSNFLRQNLLASGFHPGRLHTHYLGIPTSSALPADVAASPPRIVFAGRLVAKKGIDTALAAFTQLRSTRADAELHIVGNGPLRDMVDAHARKVGGIIVHGAQSPERTRQIMSTARFLTLPSRVAADGDAEGLGLVLLEAQSLGIPVVTSNRGGTSEALLHGQTGLAIDAANVNELAIAFSTLLDDPSRAQQMGRQAYRFVRENFDLAHQTVKLEQLYDEVLATWTTRL